MTVVSKIYSTPYRCLPVMWQALLQVSVEAAIGVFLARENLFDAREPD